MNRVAFISFVLAILVVLVGLRRVEGMKEQEKKKRVESLKKFLFLAVLALVLWVYFNNRQEGVEVYTIDKQKDDLLQYVERDSAIDPEYIKTELEDMTKDKEVILIAYSLAKTDNRGELFDLIDTTL